MRVRVRAYARACVPPVVAKVVVPPLGDEVHLKDLTAEVGHRSVGGALAASNAVPAQYRPPVLLEVQNVEGLRVGTVATSDLVLVGRDFGSVGTVLFNGRAVDPSAICAACWTDTAISLQVLALSGNVTVVVGAYRTATLRFDDFSPVLVYWVAAFAPDPAGYRTDARADASPDPVALAADDDAAHGSAVALLNAGEGARRNLTLAGVYFGTQESELRVFVGGTAEDCPACECPVRPGSLREVPRRRRPPHRPRLRL